MKNKISFLQLMTIGVTVLFFLLSIVFSVVVFNGHPDNLWKNSVYLSLTMVYLIEILLISNGINGVQLLNKVKKQELKTPEALTKLSRIAKNSLLIAVFSVGFLPMFYNFAQGDDAPGVMAIGLIIVFFTVAVYSVVSVLESLLKQEMICKKA